MSRINTNVGSLIAQKTYTRSQEQYQTALTRLSTGLRINSGKDDPAGLIASENLRRDISASEKAITNTDRANQLIGTADSALGQISNLLNDIRGLVTESANKGTQSDEQIAANQLQVDSSLDAIDRIAKVTSFQGKKILDGSLDFTTTNPGASVTDLNVNQANLGSTGSVAVAVNISAAATQGTITSSAFAGKGSFTLGGQTFALTAATAGDTYNNTKVAIDVSGTTTGVAYNGGTNTLTLSLDNTDAAITAATIVAAFATDGTFTATQTGSGTINGTTTAANTAITTTSVLKDLTFQLTGGKGAEVFSFKQGASLQQVTNAVNLVKDSTGIEASLASGIITFKSTDYGTSAIAKVDVIAEAAGGTFLSGLSSQSTKGTDIVGTINGYTATGKGNVISLNTAQLSFNATVSDGSSTNFNFTINGGGATFQLGPDVQTSQQSRIGISSVNTGKLGGSSGRLYELRSGQGKSLASDATGAAQVVDQVITKVTQARGRLGAFQLATLQSNKQSLQDTVTNLTEAQSSIRDADFAKESSNLTRAQILIQSGTTVLQQANQAPQSILSLLR